MGPLPCAAFLSVELPASPGGGVAKCSLLSSQLTIRAKHLSTLSLWPNVRWLLLILYIMFAVALKHILFNISSFSISKVCLLCLTYLPVDVYDFVFWLFYCLSFRLTFLIFMYHIFILSFTLYCLLLLLPKGEPMELVNTTRRLTAQPLWKTADAALTGMLLHQPCNTSKQHGR